MTFINAAAVATPDILDISVFNNNGKRIGRASGRLRNHDFTEVFDRKIEQVVKTAKLDDAAIGTAIIIDIESGISFSDRFRSLPLEKAIEESGFADKDCIPVHICTIPDIKQMMPLYRGAIDKIVFTNGKVSAHVSGDPENVYETKAGNNKNKARGVSALGVLSAMALIDGKPELQLQGAMLDLRDGIALDLEDIESARRFIASKKAEIVSQANASESSSILVSGFPAGTDPSIFVDCGMIPSYFNIQIAESLPMSLAEEILNKTLRKER